MVSETWKDIPGFEGRYQVSDMGRVRSPKRLSDTGAYVPCRFIKFDYVKGYARVLLHYPKSGKKVRFRVHRLVLTLFVGPPPDPSFHADHIDGNRVNNAVSNLRWLTPIDNNFYGAIRKSEAVGVYRRGDKYRASIRVNKKHIALGTYDTKEEAHAAYMRMREKIYGQEKTT